MVDVNSQRINNSSLEGNDQSAVFQVVKWLFLGGVVLCVLIASASIRKEILELRYGIENLNTQNANLVSTSDLLRAEYNSLAAPQELEKISKEMGLISSNSAEVLIFDVQNLKSARDQLALSKTQDRVLRE